MTEILAINKNFEDLKKLNAHGVEYWSARDIQSGFGYIEWRKFESSIKKAIKSCETVGFLAVDHFVGAAKLIQIAKTNILIEE